MLQEINCTASSRRSVVDNQTKEFVIRMNVLWQKKTVNPCLDFIDLINNFQLSEYYITDKFHFSRFPTQLGCHREDYFHSSIKNRQVICVKRNIFTQVKTDHTVLYCIARYGNWICRYDLTPTDNFPLKWVTYLKPNCTMSKSYNNLATKISLKIREDGGFSCSAPCLTRHFIDFSTGLQNHMNSPIVNSLLNYLPFFPQTLCDLIAAYAYRKPWEASQEVNSRCWRDRIHEHCVSKLSDNLKKKDTEILCTNGKTYHFFGEMLVEVKQGSYMV
jgi:hypothetical protein